MQRGRAMSAILELSDCHGFFALWRNVAKCSEKVQNGLKIRFPSGSGGSNPSAGTNYINGLLEKWLTGHRC